jgi:hypothetical protein
LRIEESQKERIKGMLLLRSKPNEATGCLEWQKALSRYGYGRMKASKKDELSHRLSYAAYVGEIPDGMLVCHHCDNPKCINPDHLFLGTYKDNAIDRNAKGRAPLTGGERNGCARLSIDDVKGILKRKKDAGLSYGTIAREYGVSPKQIEKIVRGERWRRALEIEGGMVLCTAAKNVTRG